MKYYGITDKGKIRKSNQDSYVIASNTNGDLFAIVCDGIGGGRGGDIASSIAVTLLSKAFSETDAFTDGTELKKWLRSEVSYVNKQIFDLGNQTPELKGMGTTLTAVLITSVGKFVVNAGDSRVYSFCKDGQFRQVTIDHTLVQDMIMHGELTREEAANFPRKNVLTNALGVWETVRCDIDTHNEPLAGFLLCSDGLHGYVAAETLKEVVLGQGFDPSLRARRLVRAALDAGGFDNITVVLIDLEEE